jgi:hypothetical protein
MHVFVAPPEYDHNLRSKICNVYPEFFLWVSDWRWSDEYIGLSAEFGGSLLCHVRRLQQKGITIMHDSWQSLRDQFVDLLI